MRFFAVILVMGVSVACHATENSNPFVSPPPVFPDAPPPRVAPPAQDDQPPQSYTENRSLFELIEVVGRSATFAVLRFPMVGSSNASMTGGAHVGGASGAAAAAQGVAYRELIVRSGRKTFIGGRSFQVELPVGSTNVLLLDGKNGKVLWEGDLSGPRIYYANPNVADYQYTPPAAAGAGVGQTSGGMAAVSAAGQSGAAQGIQPSGALR